MWQALASTLRAPFATALAQRGLIRALTVRELRLRVSGSMLGLGWLVLRPLATVAVYALVFGGILDLGPRGGGMQFVLQLFAGLLVYQAFAEPVGQAARLVVSRPNYVTKVVFPLEVLAWPPVLAALLGALVALGLLLGLHLAFLGLPGPWTLGAPLLLLPVAALALGASWLLAALGVYLRDTAEVVRVLLQLLIFLSPVIWTLDQLQSPTARGLALANPLTALIEALRAALAGTPGPPLPALLGATLGSLLFAVLGLAFFRRAREGFADVL
jgi:lipopolysaccharide transport system permease protein